MGESRPALSVTLNKSTHWTEEAARDCQKVYGARFQACLSLFFAPE